MKDEQWVDSLANHERKTMYRNFWKYKNMSHKEIRDAIIEGLHYLTTTELVELHSEISQVQIKRTHIEEEEKVKNV
jgi:hypothetical protein